MIRSVVLALSILASPLVHAAAPAPEVTAKIAEADRLRLKEWDKDGQSEKAVTMYDEALKAGADEYAMKPITREVIEDKLQLLGLA